MIAEQTQDWANLVRARRKTLGRTQASIAAEINVTRQWVSNFENGRNTGSASLADVIQLLASVGLFADLRADN